MQTLSGSQEFYKKWRLIWLGKILVNDIQFAKFAEVFPHQNFVLYRIIKVLVIICLNA